MAMIRVCERELENVDAKERMQKWSRLNIPMRVSGVCHRAGRVKRRRERCTQTQGAARCGGRGVLLALGCFSYATASDPKGTWPATLHRPSRSAPPQLWRTRHGGGGARFAPHTRTAGVPLTLGGVGRRWNRKWAWSVTLVSGGVWRRIERVGRRVPIRCVAGPLPPRHGCRVDV